MPPKSCQQPVCCTAEANLYRFSSKEFHADSGLYYYGYRFYEPSLQRWISLDPIGERGGLNLYRYVANSPLKFIDFFGLEIKPEDSEGELMMVYINHWRAKLPKDSLLRKKLEDLISCRTILHIKTLKGCLIFGEGTDPSGKKKNTIQATKPQYDPTTKTVHIDEKPFYIARGRIYDVQQALAEELLHAWWNFFGSRPYTHGDDVFESDLEEFWKDLGAPFPKP